LVTFSVRRTDREGTGSVKLAMRELHTFFIYRQLVTCTCVQAALHLHNHCQPPSTSPVRVRREP
jgi:hypothetical protein